MMTGLSCLTFVLVAFCCYAMSMSKSALNEANKKVDLAQGHQRQQQHRQRVRNEAAYETRQKRSQLDIGNGGISGHYGNGEEYRDFNDYVEELGDNALMSASQEMDLENMQPMLYFILLQKMKQLQNNERQLATRRTPRLGRSTDYQLFDGGAATNTVHDFDSGFNIADDYALSRQFLPRIMKKSVQFKPRLGKRTQVCD